MIFAEEKFTGKSGRVYTLRSPEAGDAEKMLSYLRATAEETEYGLSYADELDFTAEDEVEFIRGCSEGRNSIMISAFEGEELVGNASLFCVMDRRKTLHRASFGMAILRAHWGQGLGERILRGLISFAKEAGYEFLELEVAACNEAAVSLYKKLGFRIYGERPRSLRLQSGEYYDELLMLLELR